MCIFHYGDYALPLLRTLQELDLSHNPRLEGKLPEYWGRLTNLQRMDLSNCGLSGLLPMTWVALQNVVSIDLSNNMLGGELLLKTACCVLHAACCMLYAFGGCGLSGLLPTTWVALQNVASVDLSNNMLRGGIINTK
jgi:hypothetical protein